MHGQRLRGIPWSRGEKEHDVAVDKGGASDAPDCRVGSYGGEGRNHHGRHPASQPDHYCHTRRRRLPPWIPRQKFAIHGHAGKTLTRGQWSIQIDFEKKNRLSLSISHALVNCKL